MSRTRSSSLGSSRLSVLNGDSRKRADATAVVMTPRVRKFALTAHVTSSVGWLGAVANFLSLAIAGLLGSDDQMVRSAYLATELATWIVIAPLAFASLVTGLIVALGTSWGVFRHYWVLVNKGIGNPGSRVSRVDSCVRRAAPRGRWAWDVAPPLGLGQSRDSQAPWPRPAPSSHACS
jgi:hypothetical protein